MPPSYGTRQRVNGQHERVAQGAPNSVSTRDKGLSKATVAVSITFGSGRLTAAAGNFANFAVNDPIEVFATSGPRGFYTVTGIDTVNHAYLIVDPPPAAAGPVTASVRTP